MSDFYYQESKRLSGFVLNSTGPWPNRNGEFGATDGSFRARDDDHTMAGHPWSQPVSWNNVYFFGVSVWADVLGPIVSPEVKTAS